MSARRRLSLGQWSACGATGVLIAACLTAYGMYNDALSIDTEEINTDDWGERPDQVEGVHNFLLLGVDNESEGTRPDVLVIANVNLDAGAVTMVNVPRDLMVDIPVCDPAGEAPGWSGGVDQINHSASYGGLDCLGRTMEDLTAIHLDHIVRVDFSGFEEIVNAVGGVEMCVPEPIDDPKAHLQLEAGEQVLNGEQALGLSRSRKSTEFGSDLERIERQQRVMGALVREVTGGDFLSSPPSVYAFLDSVTDSLVVDDGLTMEKMAELAIAMREVDLERMNMVTVPNVEYRNDTNKVETQEPQASELFASVAAGEVLAGEDGSEGGDDEAETPVEPSDVSVRILNGTATDGLAAQVEPLLAQEGFTVTGTGNPEARVPEVTTIYHGPGQEAEAELLASALTSATTEEVPDLEGGALELVMIQADWGPVVGLGGGSDGAGDDGGDGGALDGLDATTAAEDEVTCG